MCISFAFFMSRPASWTSGLAIWHLPCAWHVNLMYMLDLQADKMVRCYVDDGRLLDFLQHKAAIPSGTMVLVTSDNHLDHFPLLCGVYRCVHKMQVWSPAESDLRHANSTLVLAYLDFLLAGEARAFYGNMFSSFSGELLAEFHANNKEAQFYNPEWKPDSEDAEGKL